MKTNAGASIWAVSHHGDLEAVDGGDDDDADDSDLENDPETEG